MKRYLVLYFVTLLTILPLDILFIGKISKPVFQADVGSIINPNPDMVAAVIFYLLYAVGVVIFASAPATGLKSVLLYSALFGFMCYMTFEFTNRVIIEHWTWRLVLLDTAWGTVMTAAAAGAGWLVAQKFAPAL